MKGKRTTDCVAPAIHRWAQGILSLHFLLAIPLLAAAPEFPPLPDDYTTSYDLVGEALQAQVQTDARQRDALRSLQMAEIDVENVLRLQQNATAKQQEANAAVSALNNLRQRTQKAREEAQQRLISMSQDKARREAALIGLQESEAEEKQLLADLAKLQLQLESTAEELADAPAGTRDAKLRIIRDQMRKVERRLKHVQTLIVQQRRGTNRQTFDTHSANYRRLLGQLAEFSTQYVQLQKEAKAKQATAQAAQTAAYQALLDLLETLESPKEQGAEDQFADAEAQTLQLEGSEDIPPPATRGRGGRSQALALHSAADVMEAARVAEERIADRYRGVRAADLALIREIPLVEALASTDVPKPTRDSLNEALLRSSPRSSAQLKQQNAEILKAGSQLDSMVQFGNQLLRAVLPGPGPEEKRFGATVSLGSIVSGGAGLGRQLESIATDDSDELAKDLTAFMRAESAPLNPFEDENRPSPEGRRSYIPPGLIDDETAMHAAAPGRRIAGSASGLPRHRWVYVDAWYVIGPFPNPDRRNKDRQFPPETVIDLDGLYEGEGGETLRWRFIQGGKPVFSFSAHWSIYYAYTELWFDEERDLWIAVGADDAARLWINDMLVWKSVERLKPWRINEGYRKVTFRKGLNRILYRVENGPGYGWFSLLLHTDPEAAGAGHSDGRPEG